MRDVPFDRESDRRSEYGPFGISHPCTVNKTKQRWGHRGSHAYAHFAADCGAQYIVSPDSAPQHCAPNYHGLSSYIHGL